MSKMNPDVLEQRSSSKAARDRDPRTGVTPQAIAAVEAWLASMPTPPQRWLDHVSHQTLRQSYRMPFKSTPHPLPYKP